MQIAREPRIRVLRCRPFTSPKGDTVTRTILCVALLACACDSGSKTETKSETKVETKVETRTESSDRAAPADAKTAAVAPTAPVTTKTVAVADPPGPGAERIAKTADKAAQAAAVGDATKAGDRVKAPDPATTPPADPPAAGGTVAQKEGWANYEKELDQKVAQVNKACGSKLSGSYDKSTYTDFDPMKDRTQSACQQAVGTLAAVCASDPGKQSVNKLTRTTCKFSTSGTGASLSGSTLVIKIDPEKSSITGKAAGSYSWASAIKEVI